MSCKSVMNLRSLRTKSCRTKERYAAMCMVHQKKGLLAAYQMEDPGDPTKNYCNWFMKENDIATSVLSFFLEWPSEEKIVAMEDTILFRMSKKDLFAGIQRYPGMAFLTLLIIIKYYCESTINETFLRMKHPELIFQHMLTTNVMKCCNGRCKGTLPASWVSASRSIAKLRAGNKRKNRNNKKLPDCEAKKEFPFLHKQNRKYFSFFVHASE